jgi:hypothetical protein
MSRQTLVVIVVLWAALISGCRKTSSAIVAGGGRGGRGSIWVTPTHGNNFVDSCVIYIKYGTLGAPANGVYDDSAKCQMLGITPVAIFDSLTTGQYYLFGSGYHQLTLSLVKGAANYAMTTELQRNMYLPTYSYH